MNEKELFDRLMIIRDNCEPNTGTWYMVNDLIIDRYAPPKEPKNMRPVFGLE